MKLRGILMKTPIKIAIIISLSILFSHSLIAKSIFKGVIKNTAQNDKTVWIKTNQAQSIKKGTVLYIHDKDDSTKAIIKVSKIIPRYLKAKIIDGNLDSIKSGDKVNNVYKWDGYNYHAEVVYEKEGRQITIQRNIIIDRNITYIPFEETETKTIDSQNINAIKVIRFRNSLIATEIILNDYKSIKLNESSLDKSLNIFGKKKVILNIPGLGITELSDKNIVLVKLVKRLKGILRLYKLHHFLGESAQPRFEKKDYSVTFRFLNLELGRKTLEDMIAGETDPQKLDMLVENLKLYNSDRVEGVSVVGSFNNWDSSKHPMVKDKNGIYSVKIPLSAGVYKYYFILSFSGTSNIELKVLDPYSNKVISNDESYRVNKVPVKDDKGIAKNVNRENNITGNVCVIEVPGMFTEPLIDKKIDKKRKPKSVRDSIADNKVIKKEVLKKLPYDPEELRIEERELTSSISNSNVVNVGNISYYRVAFKFDQLNMVRIEMKKAINEEAAKDSPDKKKLSGYKQFLAMYSEDSVKKVSVIIKSSESKQVKEYELNKQDDGSWTGKFLLAKGKYTYKYSIFLGKDLNNYIMNDKTSINREIDELNQEVSVLHVGVSSSEKEEKWDSDSIKDSTKKVDSAK